MYGSVGVVTGADSGVGFEIALGLARQGMTIAMVCSQEKRGQAARLQLIARAGHADIDLFVARPASVGAATVLASQLQQQYNAVDVLIHADVSRSWLPRWTREGYAYNWAHNVLVPYQLTRSLLPLMMHGDTSAVLILSGEAHRSAAPILRPRRWWNPIPLGRCRHTSAMSRLLWCYDLSQHFHGDHITFNVFSAPDFDFRRVYRYDESPRMIANDVTGKILPLALQGRTGHYYLNGSSINSAPITYQREISHRFCGRLEELLGLPPLRRRITADDRQHQLWSERR